MGSVKYKRRTGLPVDGADWLAVIFSEVVSGRVISQVPVSISQFIKVSFSVVIFVSVVSG